MNWGGFPVAFRFPVPDLSPETKRRCWASVLPALHAPTVNTLSDPSWVAIEAVVDESVVREILPKLKAAGAEGMIELALNKVVP